MPIDHTTSQVDDRSSTRGLSRRRLLQAAAARSPRPGPALAGGRCRRDGCVRTERVHPHRSRRTDRPDHALCRDGPGHLHVDPDADRRGARGGAERRCGSSTRRRTTSSTPIRCWGSRRPAIRTRSAAPGNRCARPARRREPCWWLRRRSAGTSIRHHAARKPVKCCTRRAEDESNTARSRPTRRACRCRKTCRSRRRKDFRLIGTPAKRLDTPAKVNGTAIYGIDVRPPGVKIATLAQSPVFGGRVKRVDDAAALAVKGVRQVVRLDDAVAVVADHMGAAKKGLAALVIDWDDGPHAKLTTAAVAAELENATRGPGAVAQNIGDAERALASGRHPRRRDVPGPVPGARRAGADELHGSRPPRWLRDLGRQSGDYARCRPARRKQPDCRSRKWWSTITSSAAGSAGGWKRTASFARCRSHSTSTAP